MVKSYLKKVLSKVLRKRLCWVAKRTVGWKIYHSKTLDLTFLLNTDNFVDFMIYHHGAFEQEILWSIKKIIDAKEHALFIDVGAHIGQMSLYVAKNFKNTTVIAFEPEPGTYMQHKLEQVINHLDYALYELAVGAAYGEKQLYLPEVNPLEDYGKYNNGMVTLISSNTSTEAFTKLVKTVPLADFLSTRIDINRFDKIIIKIDVEGAEDDVIKGLVPLLHAKKRIYIIIELLLNENRAGCIKTYSLLKSVGLDAYTLNFNYITNKELEVLPNGNYCFTNAFIKEAGNIS